MNSDEHLTALAHWQAPTTDATIPDRPVVASQHCAATAAAGAAASMAATVAMITTVAATRPATTPAAVAGCSRPTPLVTDIIATPAIRAAAIAATSRRDPAAAELAGHRRETGHSDGRPGIEVSERLSGAPGLAFWVSLALSVVVLACAALQPVWSTGAGTTLAAAIPAVHLDGVTAPVVLAQGDPGSVDLGTFLGNVRRVLLGLLATITICYLSIGGIRMVIAGGDPGEVERAKAALRSGVFGFLATILAPAFVGLLQSLFGGGR